MPSSAAAASLPGGNTVLVEILDRVAWVTMNRPEKRNAINPALSFEMLDVLTVGLGGIWIEALHDIRILPADIDHDGIIAELQKLKGAALLRGGRGTPAADLEAIADCVLRLGAIVRSDPRVTEIEINPLRVYAKGALALDVLMQVE